MSTLRTPTASGSSSERSLRRYLRVVRADVVLLASLLAAAALSAVAIGRRPLWFDETVSVEAARLPLHELARYLSSTEVNMGLYTALLHGWLRLGSSVVFTRSLSVLFGLATLPVLYRLAERLFDRRTARVSVALLSVNVAFIGYSREARGYSLALLLVTTSSYFFVAALQEGRRRHWALYSLTAALAILTHLLTALVVLAQLVSLLLIRNTVAWRRVLASIASVSLVVAPAAMLAVLHHQGAQIDWLNAPPARQLPGLIQWFTDSRVVTLLFFIGAIAALHSAVAEWRRGGAAATWRYGFLLLWLVLPPVLAFCLSVAKPIYLYRYFLTSLPPLILLVSAGFARFRRLWLLWPSLVLAAGFSVRTVAACLPDCKVRHDDWRGAAAFVEAHARAGDAILFDPAELKTPLYHYLGGTHDRLQLLYPERWRLTGGPSEGADTLAGGVERAGRYRRVWLVTWWLPPGDVPTLLRRQRQVQVHDFPGNVRIRLYVRRTSS